MLSKRLSTADTHKSSSRINVAVAASSGNGCWVHPSYLKDGKLRVRERYWRDFQPCALHRLAAGANRTRTASAALVVVIPDAVFWRKYLRLVQLLLRQVDSNVDTNNNNKNLPLLSWCLLESVAEYMDHRNQSPSVTITDGASSTAASAASPLKAREPAAPQERVILQRLVQEFDMNRHDASSSSCGTVVVTVFCDASVRYGHQQDDEWDELGLTTMSIEDRSRYALVRAAHMIHQSCLEMQEKEQHGDTGAPTIMLLSSDPPEERLALSEEGMCYMDMSGLLGWLEYHHYLSNDQLELFLDICQQCQDEYERRIQPASTTADDSDNSTLYLSEEAIRNGLRDGRLFKGRLTVAKENPREAFISVAPDNNKLYIDGQKGHFGHAIHQDVVVIESLPQSEWGRPVGKRRLVYHNENSNSNGGDDDDDDNGLPSQHQFDDDITTNIPPIPSARVVAVHKPGGRRTVVATMVNVPTNRDEAAVLVVPMDVRIPKIRIRTRTWHKFSNMRLLVTMDGWEEGSKYPHGHCVDILGPIGDLETEVAALLLENQVILEPFSLEAQACLPVYGDKWVVSEREASRRKDLRKSRRVFSVDPPGCQDIDDTMHAQILGTGDVEVGVHIADVSHFVKHNSALDKEAQARGTTFYLVDRRFDMLPSLLSSNLCSLHGNVDRLAVSVIWTLSSDFKEVKSCWYGRTVIRNCAAMTYDQADRILCGKPPDDLAKPRPPPFTAGAPVDPKLVPQLKEDLSILTRLGRKLKADREEIGGAVDLSSGDLGTELKFTLDENGNPTEVMAKEDKEIHHTIAEMMIMANSTVASKIYEKYPSTALLRVHRAVEENRFEDLKEVLALQGVKLDGSSNMALAESLKTAQCNTRTNPVVSSLFRSLATRAMTEARYICTGDDSEDADFSHYGLGLKQYTHFTSPIRRYADVVVHKQLLAALEDDQLPKQPNPLSVVRTPQHVVSLPESNVVSILAGEGLSGFHGGDKVVDSLTAGAAKLTFDQMAPNPAIPDSSPAASEKITHEPYLTSAVASICEGLNLHNRLAKQSSMECQGLFLSLYFRKHVEVARAVVVNVRSNGFWVYIPRFDMRGPVYVRAIDGSVQIDPGMVGLPSNAGLDPTVGFSASGKIRRFPNGTCTLIDTTPGEERLDVNVPGSRIKLSVRPLDVVTVSLSCDNWDARARVPSPRLLLLASGSETHLPSVSSSGLKISSKSLAAAEVTTSVGSKTGSTKKQAKTPKSLADALFQIRLSPVLRGVPYRSMTRSALSLNRKGSESANQCQETIKGRKVFGDFVNPDTRSAIQEAAQEAAAAESALRREQLMETSERRREYDTTRTIERTVTLRQQRLAAEKRNTRRSKAT